VARTGLLETLLLGRRDRLPPSLEAAFRRVGLAHLIAISGLHLGILAGLAAVVLRWIVPSRRWRGGLVIGLVAAYLFVVEARMPVLRAGLMSIAGATGLVTGRRWRIESLVALSALLLAAWRPDEVARPGFQLSFGVVLGLLRFVPRVQERWFGWIDRLDRDRKPLRHLGGRWVATTVVVAVVAWSVALPIVVHHFGLVSPLAVPLSVLCLPAVAVILTTGFGKIVTAVVLPSASLVLGRAAAMLADLLIWTVLTFDRLPLSEVYVPRPGTAWTLASLAWVAAWGEGLAGRFRKTWLVVGSILLLVLLRSRLPWPAPAALRLDMLDVGNGACHVVRSGRRTVVFDAGSASDLDVGRHRIVPALRRLDVRAIDAIVISHPNLDHFAAVPDLLEEFPVRLVLLPPAFWDSAALDPGGPEALVLAILAERQVPIATAASGTHLSFGCARAACLHPPPAAAFAVENDGSVVLSVAAAGRRIVLNGDIQTDGASMVMAHHPDLRAEVVELPHHGSLEPAAADYVARLDPVIVLQSTGAARLGRRTQGSPLAGVEHLVTARDGACWVEIDRSGALSVGRFVAAR
jgi:competence protein ComEC